MKDWETIAEPRVKKRNKYPGSPGAGPGILGTYRTLFERAITGKPQPTVMVLGATPELRDLVLEHGCMIISVDVNEKIMQEMTEIMKHPHDPREQIIIADWLKNPVEANAVDVVMGDGIGNNVPYADHPKLFSEIARVLKPNGYLILRELLNDPAHPRRTILETIKYVHQEKLHKYDLFCELYGYTTDGGYDNEQKLIRMERIQAKLEREIYGKEILTAQEEASLKTFMTGTVTSTFLTEREYLKNMEQFFESVEVLRATGFRFCEYFRFFFAKVTK